MFYIARLNFIYSDHTALAYRSIEPLPNLPTPLHSYTYKYPYALCHTYMCRLMILGVREHKDCVCCQNLLTLTAASTLRE